MKTYRVQMMDDNSYGRYMQGYMDGYSVENVLIKAESKKEAIAKAKNLFPAMHINDYVRSIDEIEAENVARMNKLKEEREKEQRAKEKRIAREQKNAEAIGLTVKEYQAMKRYEREVRKLEEQIAEATKSLEWYKTKLKNLKNRG